MDHKFFRTSAACAVILMLNGCGGSGSGSGNSPPIQPSPTPTQTATTTPTLSVTVQTYERQPAVAYPAVITSEVTSLTSETVSVEAPSSITEYSQLSLAKAGYQPTWYPYTQQDKSAIQLGLYKATNINKQSNFVKAIIPTDAGGWLMDYYKGGYFPTTIDRIKSIGGNNVVYADSAIIKAMDLNAKTVTLYGKYFPPDQVIYEMGNLAKARGIEFTFMMGIYPGDTLGNDTWTVPKFYSAIGTLSDNDAFWDAWFDAYKAILIERAALAQKAGATRFVIGFNLDFMTNKGNQRWAELIQAVKSAGFTGKISYFAGTNGAYNGFTSIGDSAKRASFIRLFDEIGLNFYNPVIPANGETLASSQPLTRIASSLKTQIATVSSYNVPLFVLIGTPSVHGGATSSDYIESAYTCEMLKDQVRDYQTQADVYQAAAEIVNEQNSGSAAIKGIFSWGYHYIDNPRKHLTTGDSCYDFSASIRNKPAEAVLSYWFKGW